ncbi:MAG: sialate O-acetylesterase [Candidatus Hydrogenedentota bacterium]
MQHRILTTVYVCTLLFCAQAAMATAAPVVTGGLTPHQVVQCDIHGLATLSSNGTWDGDGGTVYGRVLAGEDVLVPWMEAGGANDGAWDGAVPGVPAGGPYTVAWKVGEAGEEAQVAHVLVGDLWVLAGQSNMFGRGNQDNLAQPDPRISAFGMDREWRVAADPIHNLAQSPDPVHYTAKSEQQRQRAIRDYRDGTKGGGLGLPFAKEMLARTGRPVGLICTAHGGTSMDQWDPAKKDRGADSLYGSMLLSIEAAGGQVRGVLWYQGESDAGHAPDAYQDKMLRFIDAVRDDLGDSELPFLFVQLGRLVREPNHEEHIAGWNTVRTAQLAIEKAHDRCDLATAIDLELDDPIHIGTEGLKVLGKRLAHLAEKRAFGAQNGIGPRIAKVAKESTPFGERLRVTCTNVNGALTAAGRVNGFAITAGPHGPEAPSIYDMEIDPDQPDEVLLWIQKPPEDAHLWYGHNFNPYCNLEDEAGMALPACGPFAVE